MSIFIHIDWPNAVATAVCHVLVRCDSYTPPKQNEEKKIKRIRSEQHSERTACMICTHYTWQHAHAIRKELLLLLPLLSSSSFSLLLPLLLVVLTISAIPEAIELFFMPKSGSIPLNTPRYTNAAHFSFRLYRQCCCRCFLVLVRAFLFRLFVSSHIWRIIKRKHCPHMLRVTTAHKSTIQIV